MSEPWIRVSSRLATRSVVARISAAIKADPFKVCGHLITLWGVVSQSSLNGKIDDQTDDTIELWSGWNGKRGKWAKAIRALHLDDDGRLGGWDEYQGPLEQRRAKDRERKERSRRGPVTRTGDGKDADSPQNVRVTSRGQSAGRHAPARAVRVRERELQDQEQQQQQAAAASNSNRKSAVSPEVQLTVAMNVAIAGRWGEQPNPIGPTAGRAGLAIEELNAAGVPLDFTLAQIPDAIGRATIDAPPKSFRYVVPGIIERWRESGEATLITSATGDRLGVQRLAARWFAFLVRTGWYLLNAGQQEEMLSDESARPWPLGELTVEEIRRDWPLVGRVAADVMQSTRGEIEGVRRIAQALTAEPWRATG